MFSVIVLANKVLRYTVSCSVSVRVCCAVSFSFLVKVQGKYGDEEGEAVTYSTVRAPSSSTSATAATSADVSDLYATVDKPNEQGIAV